VWVALIKLLLAPFSVFAIFPLRKIAAAVYMGRVLAEISARPVLQLWLWNVFLAIGRNPDRAGPFCVWRWISPRNFLYCIFGGNVYKLGMRPSWGETKWNFVGARNAKEMQWSLPNADQLIDEWQIFLVNFGKQNNLQKKKYQLNRKARAWIGNCFSLPCPRWWIFKFKLSFGFQ